MSCSGDIAFKVDDHGKRLRSTLRQFARDWSEAVCSPGRRALRVADVLVQGRGERGATYKPMLSSLRAHFKDMSPDETCADLLHSVLAIELTPTCSSNVRVLVPGAGLGRLAWEVVQHGTLPSACVSYQLILTLRRFQLSSERVLPVYADRLFIYSQPVSTTQS